MVEQKTMKLARLVEPYKIQFETAPVPHAQKGQALIRVLRCGICGSDVGIYHGTNAAATPGRHGP